MTGSILERLLKGGVLWVIAISIGYFAFRNRRYRIQLSREVTALPAVEPIEVQPTLFSLSLASPVPTGPTAAAIVYACVLIAGVSAVVFVAFALGIFSQSPEAIIFYITPVLISLVVLADNLRDSVADNWSFGKLLERHQGRQELQISAQHLIVPVCAASHPLAFILKDTLHLAIPLDQIFAVKPVLAAKNFSAIIIKSKVLSEVGILGGGLGRREPEILRVLRQKLPSDAFWGF